MSKPAIALLLTVSVAAAAQTPSSNLGYTDTPMLPGLPYHVHDPARPRPATVTPAIRAGDAPSDATVLFDGTSLSAWTPAKSAWKVENGYMEVTPNSGDLRTKETFGGFQLHIEWMAPANYDGPWYNRGNNGVSIHGLYEIQIFDSFNEKWAPDGQCAAVYGQTPPLVNVCRPPGEWQSYDIAFTAPVLVGERVVQPARITMFHNGVLVHLNQEIYGATSHLRLPRPVRVAEGPVALAGHGCPVRFRNIWIRKL